MTSYIFYVRLINQYYIDYLQEVMFLRHENWAIKKRKSRERRTLKKSHKEMSKRIREEKKKKLFIEEKIIIQGRAGSFIVNNDGIIYELEIVEFSELSIRYIYKGEEYNFSKINLKEFRKVIIMGDKITPNIPVLAC